jgi:hypothetical protein
VTKTSNIPTVSAIGESGSSDGQIMTVSPTNGSLGQPARLARETEDAYQRFIEYALAPMRDEPRSFSAVARAFEVDESSVRSQATRFAWRQRCIAWDRKRTEAASMRAGELQAATAISHASVAEELVRQSHEALLITQELLAGEIDLEVMETWQRLTSSISKSIEKGQKVARLALGQSDSNTSVRVESKAAEAELDLSRLSDAELQLAMVYEQLKIARMGDGRGQLPDDVQSVLRFLEGR